MTGWILFGVFIAFFVYICIASTWRYVQDNRDMERRNKR